MSAVAGLRPIFGMLMRRLASSTTALRLNQINLDQFASITKLRQAGHTVVSKKLLPNNTWQVTFNNGAKVKLGAKEVRALNPRIAAEVEKEAAALYPTIQNKGRALHQAQKNVYERLGERALTGGGLSDNPTLRSHIGSSVQRRLKPNEINVNKFPEVAAARRQGDKVVSTITNSTATGENLTITMKSGEVFKKSSAQVEELFPGFAYRASQSRAVGSKTGRVIAMQEATVRTRPTVTQAMGTSALRAWDQDPLLAAGGAGISGLFLTNEVVDAVQSNFNQGDSARDVMLAARRDNQHMLAAQMLKAEHFEVSRNENVAMLAAQRPDLYNSMLHGRKFPRGAVPIGGVPQTDMLDEITTMMARGDFIRAQTPLSSGIPTQ